MRRSAAFREMVQRMDESDSSLDIRIAEIEEISHEIRRAAEMRACEACPEALSEHADRTLRNLRDATE